MYRWQRAVGRTLAQGKDWLEQLREIRVPLHSATRNRLRHAAVAVIVVVPVAWAFTRPAFPGELLTKAADGLEEVQMTDCRVCVLPSLNVPVATNCWVCPGIRNELAGVTDMDTRLGGVRLVG